MIEKIKKTDTWQKLLANPKFEEKFNECVNSFSYIGEDLLFEVSDNKITVIHTSRIIDRDLDCQYKLFDERELIIDDENNLIINELSGKLESRYGYTFANTNGGVVNTYYCCQYFNVDGIELAYHGYTDKHHLDSNEFMAFKDDLKTIVEGAYNPKLIALYDVTGVYPHANIIGKNSTYIRRIRSMNDLGIIEVTRCSYDNNGNPVNVREELYFNTFFTSTSKHSPELIHIMNGFPFAIFTEDKEMKIDSDYLKQGLDTDNYHEVSRDRFLKELSELRESIGNDQKIISKYDLMIDRVEKEIVSQKRIH